MISDNHIDNLLFFGGAYGLERRALHERAEEILALTDLSSNRATLTSSLPGGIRQRLALGCAILHRPEVVFLDEPTSGVDPVTRQHFWNFIKQLASGGMTIFVTTHYMDEARFCERIVMINAGNIVASGTPTEIIAGACPGNPDADLNDAFITLMKRDET